MDFLVIVIIICALCFIRVVPAKTALIIDRNSHYCKTKKGGIYLFNPTTDKVTTKISTFPVTETYSNTFETHDSYFYRTTFTVTYVATDIDMVLSSLQDSRRSIYDVINCSVETVMSSLVMKDMSNRATINQEMFHQLESMLEPFYIDVTSFKLISLIGVSQSLGQQERFKKHVSRGDNPISD